MGKQITSRCEENTFTGIGVLIRIQLMYQFLIYNLHVKQTLSEYSSALSLSCGLSNEEFQECVDGLVYGTAASIIDGPGNYIYSNF